MKSRIGILVAGCLALWAVLFFPARLVGGEQAVVQSLLAGLICLIPTAVTLVWAAQNSDASPRKILGLVVLSTGIRVGFVLGTAGLLALASPDFRTTAFWIWILVYYLFTLVLETILLRRQAIGQQ